MIKRIGLLVVVALTAAMMMVATAAPAFAASPSQEQCEAQDDPDTAEREAIFDRDRGTVSCTTIDEGKPHPRDKFTERDTVSSNGTFNNEPQEEDPPATCSDTGSGKCPKGQFPDD